MSNYFHLEFLSEATVLRLDSPDQTNRLTSSCVQALTESVEQLASDAKRPLIITGNERFFSAGADLNEILALSGPATYGFSLMGQRLMNAVADFPAPVFAAIRGYCMGGGLDLALACHRRLANHHAVFGHRGAALGLITGWGGTQRLPRLIGKARAVEMLVAAEKLSAEEALRIGLIAAITEDPIMAALNCCHDSEASESSFSK